MLYDLLNIQEKYVNNLIILTRYFYCSQLFSLLKSHVITSPRTQGDTRHLLFCLNWKAANAPAGEEEATVWLKPWTSISKAAGELKEKQAEQMLTNWWCHLSQYRGSERFWEVLSGSECRCASHEHKGADDNVTVVSLMWKAADTEACCSHSADTHKLLSLQTHNTNTHSKTHWLSSVWLWPSCRSTIGYCNRPLRSQTSSGLKWKFLWRAVVSDRLVSCQRLTRSYFVGCLFGWSVW